MVKSKNLKNQRQKPPIIIIINHTGKQGPQSSVENKAGIKKYATETYSPQQDAPEDSHTEEAPHSGLQCANSKNPYKGTRQKWTWDKYKEIMEAYYTATLRPPTASASIWKHKNPTI